jgi:hypothetical protein
LTDVSVTVDITVDSTTGAQPTDPSVLNDNLISLVTSINPGYTVLPAGLVEDLSSTATYALAQIDAMVVDLINSIAATTANPWLLIQMGVMVGVQQGGPSNTSVEVVFTDVNAPGFVIAKGVVVSDGTNQFTVQDAGAIGTSGSTPPLFCLSNNPGNFAVPPNTVTQIVTSIPGVVVACNNPTPGTPGTGPQTEAQYRSQVLQAWRASAQGMATYLRTLLEKVPGVQARLINIVQQTSPSGWEIIVGGGDQYQVAQAILEALFDISNLTGSKIDHNRNISVTLSYPPDIYRILFVQPPQQSIEIQLVYTTTAPNFVSQSAVATIGGPAIVDYINSILVGQPINQYVMEEAFTNAIVSILETDLISNMTWTVSINGTPVTPVGLLYSGDPESYFFATLANVVINSG